MQDISIESLEVNDYVRVKFTTEKLFVHCVRKIEGDGEFSDIIDTEIWGMEIC